MALFSRIFQAVRSWRRRPGGPKTASNVGVSVEHLDHRQLLSVNFTGNVATDFPASLTPGVVILPNNPSVSPAPLAPEIAGIVKVSGWDVNGIRVTYTPADDTLSVGLEQPPSQQPDHPGPVLAGDPDNNGNDGTVNPLVTAAEGAGFRDFPSFGGSEHMAAFLDLKGTGNADVVAGFSATDPRSPKEYQVAQAVVNGTPEPDFGTELPAYEGNVYKVNSQQHPNLEFSIAHFSQLYTAETGKALTADSVIGLGAFGGSGDDPGIGEALFPSQSFRLGNATPPTPPPAVCPPVSPPVIINVHENRHINTAHDTLVRVNVLGSSGFNVANIIPSTVTLGGAHPVFSFDRFINKDEWPDATFVFKGTDVHLPAGYTQAAVTGNLTDGTSFSSSVRVFNRDSSFYSPSQVAGVQQREAARATRQTGFTILPNGSPLAGARGVIGTPTVAAATATPATVAIPGLTTPAALKVSMTPQSGTSHAASVSRADAAARTPAAPPVVSIKRREPVVVSGQTPAAKASISPKLQASMNRYVRSVGALNANTGAPVATGGS